MDVEELPGEVTRSRPAWDYRRGAATTRALLAVGETHGVRAPRLLGGTPLTPDSLKAPGVEVEACDEMQVARNLLASVPPGSGLGVDAALRVSFSSLGPLGLALMSAPTVREALRLGIRMRRCGYLFTRPIYRKGAGGEVVTLDDTGIPDDVCSLLVERDFAMFARFLPIITGRTTRIRVAARLGQASTCKLQAHFPELVITWGETNTLALDRNVLDAATPQADQDACRDVLVELDSLITRRAHHRPTTAHVRARIMATPAQPPTMEQLAREMFIDVRTLRRHLSQEGTSYRAVIDEVRSTLAASLLSDRALAIERVAAQLGYSDAAGFSTAFKRWHGVAPAVFRRSRRVIGDSRTPRTPGTPELGSRLHMPKGVPVQSD